jgi:uncharacterized integral membrane protein
MNDQEQPPPSTPTPPPTPAKGTDPLRGSRTSTTWVAVSALVLLLVLLLIFIIQNTQDVSVTFFGWSGQAPLAVALLIAATSGMVVAVIAGALRILQLRRRIRRDRSPDSR